MGEEGHGEDSIPPFFPLYMLLRSHIIQSQAVSVYCLVSVVFVYEYLFFCDHFIRTRVISVIHLGRTLSSSVPVWADQQEALRGTCTLRSNFGRPESIELLLVRASRAASICTFTKAKTGGIFTSHSLVEVFVLPSFVFGCSFILFYCIFLFSIPSSATESESRKGVSIYGGMSERVS